jgi:murein DD-endopeptidase MepM/ murein hydrolase activator NlpD
MALFGDKRTYIYMKSAIGASTHMGVDLASTQNAPVEAANNGIVLYAGYLGIYGNMVILDHGLGISTHYAHMNSIKVKPGQVVKKGEIIGNTGMTGFAGGDHLHYGMMVGNKFVNPIEWWDPHWIKDNVEGKLNIQVP